MRTLKFFTIFLLAVFIMPALTHLAVWSVQDRPNSWRDANWSSAGILPKPPRETAQIMLMAARTGGMKGAFATHSWLVLKRPGETTYNRYDVVGWGTPVRHNAYAADARWYSNVPQIYQMIEGAKAESLITKVEAAIKNYRYNQRGDYVLWPGPNSNTFVATILNEVPELNWQMPATAVGRDFPADRRWFSKFKYGGWRLSLAGYAGITYRPDYGVDLQFLGLVAGFDWFNYQLKVPGFGVVG
ncbi:DUF3750 domain-containing protein [Pseudahrensia aquimaris]|uniref:DUF3750 domain-containing protein n=2 Tax=Pseudahrensia aquimaris TaxID=744461 RepID=A0ABW3FDC2_9HYPH